MRYLLSLLLVAVGLSAAADVQLHGLFTDNMVIQRETRAPVWGWAEPGEKVTVTTSWGAMATNKAGKDGAWMVKVKTPAAGGPYTITVTGNNTVTLDNVLSGDVWICGGQSNMDFDFQAFTAPPRAPEDVAERNAKIMNSAFPTIRSIVLEKQYRAEPQKDIVVLPAFEKSWQVCDKPGIIGGTSAVGFFFGRALNEDLGVPIGLLDSNRGGTRVELWMDAESLGMTEKLSETNGVAKGNTVLYNGMIAPLIPFAIKGAIWYQGESNAGNFENAIEYGKLFPDMITCWRGHWKQGKFPFLYVELAAFKEAQTEPVPASNVWPYLRESQAAALKLKNVGMASAIDVGQQKDIHPYKKDIVGQRLAAAAKEIAYDMELVYTGPTFDEAKFKDGKAIIEFEHTGSGLETRAVNLDGFEIGADTVAGFAICGADKRFVKGDAQIEGDTVVVSSPEVAEPVAVRYAWADFPLCNLYNKEGFPANPFRTDEFPPPAAN